MEKTTQERMKSYVFIRAFPKSYTKFFQHEKSSMTIPALKVLTCRKHKYEMVSKQKMAHQ